MPNILKESLPEYIMSLERQNRALIAYAEHMRARYQAHREHFGTEGTYPHPDSVALLEVALSPPPANDPAKGAEGIATPGRRVEGE